MAKGTLFTVTHPDGSVDVRRSTTKAYTHAVVSVQDPAILAAEDRAEAIGPRGWGSDWGNEVADRYEAQAAAYEAMTEPIYVVLRWSQSEANAHNGAKEFESWTRYGAVYVVQVD